MALTLTEVSSPTILHLKATDLYSVKKYAILCLVQCMDFEDSVTTRGTKEELSIEV